MKFTVIIPTRERADTLYYSLKTCVTQDYDHLEILVSDNYSQDNTREVVESFEDPRIRYINTGRRVSMTANWEFALSHVDTGYVTYIGDDDGLLPDAISDVRELLEEFPAQVLSNYPVAYHWPTFHDTRLANLIIVPTQCTLYQVNGSAVLRAAGNCIIRYGTIPMLYNSFVNMTVCSALKKGTNRFFHSMSPDIYSGFAIMSMEPNWLYWTRPFYITGRSCHSTGAACLRADPTDSIYTTFFEEADQMPCHPKMRIIPGAGWCGYLEAMLQAKDQCLGERLQMNMRRGLRNIYRSIATVDKSIRETCVKYAREVALEHGLKEFALKLEKLYPHSPRQGDNAKIRPSPGFIYADATAYDVTDVYEASVFAGKLIGGYRKPMKILDISYYDLIAYKIYDRIFGTIHSLSDALYAELHPEYKRIKKCLTILAKGDR